MTLRALIVIAVLMSFAAPDLAVAQGAPPEVGNQIVPALRAGHRVDLAVHILAFDQALLLPFEVLQRGEQGWFRFHDGSLRWVP